MKALSPMQVNRWLVQNGYLTDVLDPATGKSRKFPTPQGDELGITVVQKQSRDGNSYPAVVFNSNAQRFILSNLDEIKVFVK